MMSCDLATMMSLVRSVRASGMHGCSNRDRWRHREDVQCSMSIDRDDSTERKVRVDRIMTEFREAQARRGVKPKDTIADADLGVDETGPPAVSDAQASRRLP